MNGKRSAEIQLLPGPVTRVTIDPDDMLPDLDRANNVWTSSNGDEAP